MIANAIFVASLFWLAMAMYVMSELAFLAPHRELVSHVYGSRIAFFAALLFVNLFAVAYWVNRKLFLKDTGQKLAHIEKQLRTGSTISEDLSDHLDE